MKPECVKIGEHQLWLGDCLEVLPTLDPVLIYLVLTDPPYGINLRDNSQGGRYGRKRSAWEYSIDGDESAELGIAALDWCLLNDLPTIAFSSPKLPWPGDWSSYLVWDKGQALGGGGDVRRCWKQTWEMIQVARCGILNGQRDSAVLKFWNVPDLSAEHPAAKPVELLSYLIEKATDPENTVLDMFMGIASTGVACIRTGRKFIGIEKDPKYFDIAVRRMREAEGIGSLFCPQENPNLFAELPKTEHAKGD
jgi:site-specific DNA-methyltransferase (adenine-specific)